MTARQEWNKLPQRERDAVLSELFIALMRLRAESVSLTDRIKSAGKGAPAQLQARRRVVRRRLESFEIAYDVLGGYAGNPRAKGGP